MQRKAKPEVPLQTDLPCSECEFIRTKPNHVLTPNQIIFIKKRQNIKEFAKFLFNETDVGVLDCHGLVKTEILAEKILSFLLEK